MAASRRNQSDKLALPLMVLSFVVMGGFLYYLYVSGEASSVSVVEAAEGDSGSTARQVAWSEFAAAPESFTGERIRLADLEVVSRVGDQAFWVETPGGSYYMIRLLPALVDGGVSVTSGSVVTVTGTVHAMADSVLSVWEANGVVTSGQRAEAEFATSFVEADEAEVRNP